MADGSCVAFCTLMSCLLTVTNLEKVKIVEEPAVYRSGLANYYQPGRSSSQADNTLKARVKPSPVSGPPHLKVLAGRCYSLVHNGYKYEFCPFNNVTQREQAVRWNAFAGILGVWKEWVIVNNTFQAMLLANGDMCPGEKPRQTKVLLKCGDVNKVVSVSEPVMCQYEMQFESPLACPLDAFLVYPALTVAGRREWEKIEEALYREELTMQGYKKYRRRLFQREHFIPLDRTEKENMEDEKQVNKAIDIVLTNVKGETAGEKASFKTKEECSKAYAKLLAEVESLREELNRKSLSCTDSKHTTPTNSSFTKIVQHRSTKNRTEHERKGDSQQES